MSLIKRLLSWPFVLVFGALLRYPKYLALVPRIVPGRLLQRIGGKSRCLGYGYHLLQNDDPEGAWRWLRLALEMGRPSIDEYLLGANCLYNGLGRFRDAMALLEESNKYGDQDIKALGLENVSVRVLDSIWARHIGHCAQLDYVIKLGILEGRSKDGTILYVPRGTKVANPYLLQLISQCIRVVERPEDLPFAEAAVQPLHYDLLGPRLSDGSTAYIWDVGGRTYRRWQQEGKEPLLSLPSETIERGWEALGRIGVPRGAWFVALHVREGKWDGQSGGLHGILNADIATYADAMAEITGRGGWVIRMGDSGMKPLPDMPNVLDYCHSDLRADWMDIFIASQCRFMLGTSSGPAYLPTLFGVPAVLTNWWPPAQPPWQNSDIFIPKMPRRRIDGRYLTLSETLREPVSYCHSFNYLAKLGLRVEDNDPEIIRRAVAEMLERLESGAAPDPEVSRLRQNADTIYQSHGVFCMSQLSAEYLTRHGDLIV